MPIYRYRCDACKKEFEINEPKINDNRVIECIAQKGCGGAAKRLIARSSFSLKGKGWFKDGY